MNLGTGAFTPLGPGVASNSAGGLAGAPGGPFFTTDADGHVQRFTPAGAVTDVGNTGTGPGIGPNGVSVVGGLTNGSVFALDFSNRLLAVNTSTAPLSLLGTLGLPAQEQQYDGNMVTSFNGDNQYLYYTLEIDAGPNAIATTLFRIDPATLQSASRALVGLTGRLIGSGFVGGAYYGFTGEGRIYNIDKLTGVATLYGSYDSGVPPGGGPPFTGVFGVVDTPEPGSLLMAGTGVAALMLKRRRS